MTEGRWWQRPLALLAASHAVVVLLGWTAGSAYFGITRGSVQATINGIARQPRANAASLTFRFGSADQARVLLGAVPLVTSDSTIASADLMLTELRLAVLEGEHVEGTHPTPHLAAAADACARFQPNCELAELRAMATKLANQRAQSP